MYHCESCGRLQAAGTPSVRMPIQTRTVTYPHRKGVYPALPPKPGLPLSRRRHGERRDDPGGQGRETVRELRCCPVCAENLRLQMPGRNTGERRNPRARASAVQGSSFDQLARIDEKP